MGIAANLQLPVERQVCMHLYAQVRSWRTVCSIENCTYKCNSHFLYCSHEGLKFERGKFYGKIFSPFIKPN